MAQPSLSAAHETLLVNQDRDIIHRSMSTSLVTSSLVRVLTSFETCAPWKTRLDATAEKKEPSGHVCLEYDFLEPGAHYAALAALAASLLVSGHKVTGKSNSQKRQQHKHYYYPEPDTERGQLYRHHAC